MVSPRRAGTIDISVQKYGSSKKRMPGRHFEHAKSIYKEIMHRHG